MAVKLLMTWDIIPGREQEYFEFVVRDFVPGTQRLGLEPTDAWFTMYGVKPQIMTGMQSPSMTTMDQTLQSEEWKALVNQLLDYVTNYQYKVVQSRGGFQM
jgi:hypothetical protein